jgi:membrane protease YdiL (CAAX protease family)
MNRKQKIAIIAPLVLVAVMYPVFHSLAGVMNDRLAWYLGLVIYWLIWGAVFPLLIIGRDTIKELIRPQKPDKKILLLVAIPLVGALAARLILGGYEKESVWIALLIFSTPFGNGFFEEVLWRGVYVKLFPNNIFFWMIWPSVWFALWHYVPGSVSGGNPAGLMIGSGMMGFYLSFLTKKTGTLWWAIVFHIVGGIIMVA